jgi:hypothetical protein
MTVRLPSNRGGQPKLGRNDVAYCEISSGMPPSRAQRPYTGRTFFLAAPPHARLNVKT